MSGPWTCTKCGYNNTRERLMCGGCAEHWIRGKYGESRPTPAPGSMLIEITPAALAREEIEVTDPEAFAAAVCDALTAVAYGDGSSPMARALDEAVKLAMVRGADGVSARHKKPGGK